MLLVLIGIDKRFNNPGRSHAMAVKIESGMMMFFDPNKGEFCVPFIKQSFRRRRFPDGFYYSILHSR
ncbi:YopT-type cysteine protease domain-containing protein [Buttiauxella gaviniae]|uniref:YopT-type cysteine protease domain-containing protein n=1 Tax=Buttiauxella gaviniae TaxID=82990 RepID=A0ABV3NYP5_9ENTR